MTLKAPWTTEKIEVLAELQRGERYGHPYTCPDRGDGKHLHNGNDLGCLTPTTAGWICESCGYLQDWAHESSLSLPKLVDFNARFGL